MKLPIFVVTISSILFSLPLYAAPILNDAQLPQNEIKEITNSWLEINLDQFERNINQFKKHLKPSTEICAVMKADAYGNGINGLINTVIDEDITCIAVTSNEEIRVVRDSGFNGKIVRIRTAGLNEIQSAFKNDVEEIVGSLKHAENLSNLAQKTGKNIKVHLVLNSGGMGRNGVDVSTQKGIDEAVKIATLPDISIVGIMTHFPNYERKDILKKAADFKKKSDEIISKAKLNRDDIVLHAANSYTALNVPEAQFDMVRPGGVFYGDLPTNPEYPSIVSYKTRVASLQKMPKGATVGYDSTVTLNRDSILANLPVGYSDGYPRKLGNKADVLINGHRAKVVGVTSMNTTMVDVTDIPNVQEQTEVVLFGSQNAESIKSSELENMTGLIFPELYTVWGTTNPRIYVKNNS